MGEGSFGELNKVVLIYWWLVWLNMAEEGYDYEEYTWYEDEPGQRYYRGFTVVGDYCPMAMEMNGRPNSWVCTNHTDPNGTVVWRHPEHGDEKWSGSEKRWHYFFRSTDAFIARAEKALDEATDMDDWEKAEVRRIWERKDWYRTE